MLDKNPPNTQPDVNTQKPKLKLKERPEPTVQPYSTSKGNKQKKPLGFFSFLVILMLIAGIAAGVLQYLGKLQPIINTIMRKLKTKTQATQVETPKPEITTETNSISVAIAKEPAAESLTEEPKPTAPIEDKLAQDFRKKFNPLKIGSSLSIKMLNNSTLSGTIEDISEQSIQIKTDKMSMTIARKQLSAISRARCYEDDYVRYMVAMYNKQKAYEENRRAALERMKAKYAEMLANKRSSTGDKSNPSQNVDIDNADFKAWMEQQGATDLLKARQQRVNEYESKRRAANKEY